MDHRSTPVAFSYTATIGKKRNCNNVAVATLENAIAARYVI